MRPKGQLSRSRIQTQEFCLLGYCNQTEQRQYRISKNPFFHKGLRNAFNSWITEGGKEDLVLYHVLKSEQEGDEQWLAR